MVLGEDLWQMRSFQTALTNAGLTVNRMVNWVSRRVFTTPMEMGMRFAGTVEIAGLDTPPHWERADRLLELGRKMYPSMVRNCGGISPRPIAW